jgi:hypothetical protein
LPVDDPAQSLLTRRGQEIERADGARRDLQAAGPRGRRGRQATLDLAIGEGRKRQRHEVDAGRQQRRAAFDEGLRRRALDRNRRRVGDEGIEGRADSVGANQRRGIRGLRGAHQDRDCAGQPRGQPSSDPS